MGAVKGAAPNHPVSDEGKESFDLIQPGTAGGGEVEVETASLLGL